MLLARIAPGILSLGACNGLVIAPDTFHYPECEVCNECDPVPEASTVGCPVPTNTAIVSEVVDGDTLEKQDESRIRLLGVNAPGKAQFYYNESTRRLEELVFGKTVFLERDVTDKGKYCRLLRHVFWKERT